MSELAVTLSEIQAAAKVLGGYLSPSPLLFNPWLSENYGCEVFLKLENMQPVGSFKIRGATYKISQLSSAEKAKGVVAASLGNHAQGVAWGSRRLGVDSLIVMPRGASMTKIENTQNLGAKVQLEGNNVAEANQIARKIAADTGRLFIHPYQDAHVIAGQGTIALEILKQLPDTQAVIGAVGGGGLMAGVAIAFQEMKPEVEIFGAQAEGVAPMVQSFHAGKVVEIEPGSTFADGISVPSANAEMLALLKDRLTDMVSEPDENIAAAVLSLMEKAKVVTEGAGALPLAALKQLRDRLKNKKVVLIICGGNIDVNVLSRVIDTGLVRSGRRIRLHALITDRPGSLSKLTAAIGQSGANILQVIHDRNEPSTRMDQTVVELTLETRSYKHSQQVLETVRENALRMELVS